MGYAGNAQIPLALSPDGDLAFIHFFFAQNQHERHFRQFCIPYFLPDEDEIEFKDNPDFNVWLDEANLLGNLSYSLALFEQDKIAYEQQLLEYSSEHEEFEDLIIEEDEQ